jgi:hypothetical protein
MSQGEVTASTNPWTDQEIDPAKLMGLVASASMAVESAEGDLIGAKENMRAEVAAAQARIDSAEERLEDKQAAVTERLNRMDLLGRSMDIRSGVSLAVVEADEDGFTAELAEHNLAGSKGVLVGHEVGALLGKPTESAGTIVLLVETTEDSPVPKAVYAVAADKTGFKLGELPKPQPED